jgi:hypothetical protein
MIELSLNSMKSTEDFTMTAKSEFEEAVLITAHQLIRVQ